MQLEQLEKFFPTAHLQKYLFKLEGEAGGLAQMVERALRKCEVAGSMPASSSGCFLPSRRKLMRLLWSRIGEGEDEKSLKSVYNTLMRWLISYASGAFCAI